MPERRDALPPLPCHAAPTVSYQAQPQTLAIPRKEIPLVILDEADPPRSRTAAASVRVAHDRRRGRPRLAIAAMIVFAGLSGALAFGVLADAGRGTRVLGGLLPGGERLMQLAGFGIDQVVLTGQRYTADGDVFEALDLASTRTFAGLDKKAARARIEALPWVDTAVLATVWPGGLEVRITERKAAAVWSRGEREFLIDKTGRVLGGIRPGSVSGLPRFAGEGAASEAMSLATTLERFPELARRVVSATRVGERRWTLNLDANTTIHLPPDREAAALGMLAGEARLARVLASGNRIIDLRTPGRAAVRAQAVRTSEATAMEYSP